MMNDPHLRIGTVVEFSSPSHLGINKIRGEICRIDEKAAPGTVTIALYPDERRGSEWIVTAPHSADPSIPNTWRFV
jgi:hypothetical protein